MEDQNRKAMKKISTRDYTKNYILHLLPCVNKTGAMPYYCSANEANDLNKWTRSLIRQLIVEPTHSKNIFLRSENIKKHGGVIASLETIIMPKLEQITPKLPALVYLDLSYAVTKEVQVFIGGIDVTPIIAKSDKLTGLVTRFMKELYVGHEEYYGTETSDEFIEEMFLIDDVQMVLDERSQFRLQVDQSLRDYLVALNSRLRVNA